MNGSGSGDGRTYDVAVNPTPPPEREVVDAEPEDARKRDAALASTFDPEFTHDGKTDEQMIKERDDNARLLADVAIVTGIVLAVEAARRDDDDPGEENADLEVTEVTEVTADDADAGIQIDDASE